MKTYSIDKIVNAILSLDRLHKMSNFATSKVGKDVRVISLNSDACYSSCDYWDGMRIQLGNQFYPIAFDDRAPVPAVDLKAKYKHIAMIMYGAYYHELFHLLYTPFGYATDLLSGCNQYFQQFVHTVANILEDQTIEGTGMNRYPFSEKYIMATREVFKLPNTLKLIEESITEEPDNPGTMLGYLLHFCRGTDMSQFPEYKLWNDHKEFIEWGAYKCINTIDPHLRAKRQVAYGLELTKILDMKEPEKSNVESPNLSNLASDSSGFSKSSSGKGMSAINKSTGNMGNENAERTMQGQTQPQESDEDAAKPPEEMKEVKAQHGSGDGECPTDSGDLTKAGITQLANDEPVFGEGHYADKISKYIKTEKYLPEYNKVVRLFETQIRNVVAIIRKMYATNNASWNHYKTKGKLDMSTIYKKGNYKIFKKKNAPAPTADLVFEILVDNSGSMTGTKAKLAGKALIIFCEALNRLHIPFSVDCFTESRCAITISLKDYDELYDKVKTNMTLFTEGYDVHALNTWCGNVDEINLRYVADKLSQRLEKDKVLIVISDGATCGSWKTLKKVADNIAATGVTMLGIGIFDSNVEMIYKNSMIVKNVEDLQGLGTFLNNYLIKKIFKGGE